MRAHVACRALAVVLFASWCGSGVAAEDAEAQARRVAALADRWVKEIETRFPIAYLGSGLATDRHDSLDQNQPRQLASWREFLADAERELAGIPEERLVGRPEWVTWHYMRQGLAQSEAARLCRNELWQVSTLGWVAHLTHLATLQPVGTDSARKQALKRWRSVPVWVEQEIANLREGTRLGYTATQSSVRGVIAQLEALLAGEPGKSPFMSPATREESTSFRAEWATVVEKGLWPALRKYRDFLRDDYLPRARKSVALSANTNGLACYRATINANTTVDDDPATLLRKAQARVEAERALTLELGKKLYGDEARDWQVLAALVRDDPRYRFATRADIAAHAKETVARAAAAMGRMVRDPPSAAMKIEPFPDHMQRAGPGGEYVPGADDGSRPPIFYFRDDPAREARGAFEMLVFHETVPGHHLQAVVLAQNQRAALHPIARVLWFSGPGEGWATYAETLAYELGLYTSDYEAICALMSTTTPNMVTDLGIQLQGWSEERAAGYLAEANPLGGRERAERMVAMISGLPALGSAYPLGAMQFDEMRKVAHERLGDRFDLREFHRIMLEDGRLPFPAMRGKLMRWLVSVQGQR